MTFGLPVAVAPKYTDGGDVEKDRFLHWIEERIEVEEERKRRTAHMILCPTSLDVLCGRGKPYQGALGSAMNCIWVV